MQKTRKKLLPADVWRIALCALTPLSLALIAAARGNPDWTERAYSLGWYQTLSRAISALTARVPFSVGEWLLYLFAAGCIVYIIFWIRAVVWEKGRRWRAFAQYLFTAFTICSVLLAGFVATCGLNYYRYTFTQYSGLTPQPTELSVLKELSAQLVSDANTLREDCNEDADGVFSLDGRSRYELAAIAGQSMGLMGERYGTALFSCGAATVAKPVTFGRLMSYLDLLGVFFPYTAEANVNTDPWDYETPCTMCHELSHVCGFMREDEANFIAYNACMATGDADFMYSGTMLAMIHTTNALYAKDRDAYRELMATASEGVRRDLHATAAYWKQFDTPVATVSNAVNDTYLKANAQADGVESYGRMVDLLIAQYRAQQNDN